MENRLNEEKKYLPVCYVVNTWDAKTEALKSSETHHQTWQRVDGYDLPSRLLTVTATPGGKLAARSLTLTDLALTR
jgi:hypothetical protein